MTKHGSNSGYRGVTSPYPVMQFRFSSSGK